MNVVPIFGTYQKNSAVNILVYVSWLLSSASLDVALFPPK